MPKMNIDLASEDGPEQLVFGKCTTLYREKKYKEALDVLEKDLEKNPSSAPHICFKGYCLYGLGKNADALAAFEKAADLEPKRWEPQHGRGLALLSLKKTDKSLEAFENAITKGNRAESYFFAAALQNIKGNKAKSDEYIKKAATINPKICRDIYASTVNEMLKGDITLEERMALKKSLSDVNKVCSKVNAKKSKSKKAGISKKSKKGKK